MYNINILIAEDEDHLRRLVVKYLKNEGYHVFEAEDGAIALDLFQQESIDLVILDIMMPKLNGYMVLKKIRETSDVPTIILTASGEEEDKLFGFELGVDDYVTKPFSAKELVARVGALLKRSGKAAAVDELTVGDIVINHMARRVLVGETEIELTPKEYDLLVYFIDNINRALSREQILNRIWGYDYFGEDRTVDTVVKRLRKKLLNEGDRIQTIRGVGYRFDKV